jgi:hypothetical protein
MAIDDRENFLRLFCDAFAGRCLGHDACEIDGVAMDDGLAHARPGFETLDGHAFLQIKCRRLLDAPARHPQTALLQQRLT